MCSYGEQKDNGSFNLFSDDDNDWDTNPDHENWGSEEDLDVTSIDDKIADGETLRLTDSAVGHQTI